MEISTFCVDINAKWRNFCISTFCVVTNLKDRRSVIKQPLRHCLMPFLLTEDSFFCECHVILLFTYTSHHQITGPMDRSCLSTISKYFEASATDSKLLFPFLFEFFFKLKLVFIKNAFNISFFA